MLPELLIPRKSIKFKPLQEGQFIPLTPDLPKILHTPHIRSNQGSIHGFESGYRSRLVKVGDELYKIKGCRPEKGKRGNGPKGTQIFGLAQFEAENTLERREYFQSIGVDYPIEPVGFWVYDHFSFQGKQTAATIYRIKGDTRLDELVWYLDKMPIEAESKNMKISLFKLLYQTGKNVGEALKIFHEGNFAWDWDVTRTSFNAHHGNIVVYPNNEVANFGIVDFDNSVRATEQHEQSELIKVQAVDLQYLSESAESAPVVSTPKSRYSVLQNSGDIVDKILKKAYPHIPEDLLGMIGGQLLVELDIREDQPIRKALRFGIDDGYSRIRKNEPVSW